MDQFQSKLFDRINYERQVRLGTGHFKLQSILELLRRLEQPHLRYPVVHVAGTKGKGSTSAMIGSILTASGRKTGVYTSPHLETIRQRIAIDGEWISNGQLEATLAEMDPVIQDMDRQSQAYVDSMTRSAGEINDSAANASVGAGSPVACEVVGAPDDSTTITVIDSESAADDLVAAALQPVDRLDLQHRFGDAKIELIEDPFPVTKPLTFFEIITAAAMLYFAKQQCEAVVLEVGLGGRLDSTNVCQPEVAVITNISLDHTRQLGSTIDKIAFEKAGIIKPGVPVVSGATAPLAADVIQEVADQRAAPLQLLGRDFSIDDSYQQQASGPIRGASIRQASINGASREHDQDPLRVGISGEAFAWQSHPGSLNADQTEGRSRIENLYLKMPGDHQRLNAALAIATIETLNRHGNWGIKPDAIRKGLAQASLAGRTEIMYSNPTVILDIAHNEASIAALMEVLQRQWSLIETARSATAPRGRRRLLFGTSKDKDCRTMLASLVPFFDEITITEYQLNPRALEAQQILEMAQKEQQSLGRTMDIQLAEDPPAAWRQMQVANPQDLICVAGSAFLIAEVRPLVQQWREDQ